MLFDDGLQCGLFRLLQSDPMVSQRALAKALGISLGKVNYCLKAFVDRGWVRPIQDDGNRRGYAYTITPDGMEARERIFIRFLQCRLRQYQALQEEIEALRQETQERPLRIE